MKLSRSVGIDDNSTTCTGFVFRPLPLESFTNFLEKCVHVYMYMCACMRVCVCLITSADHCRQLSTSGTIGNKLHGRTVTSILQCTLMYTTGIQVIIYFKH